MKAGWIEGEYMILTGKKNHELDRSGPALKAMARNWDLILLAIRSHWGA